MSLAWCEHCKEITTAEANMAWLNGEYLCASCRSKIIGEAMHELENPWI